MTDIYQLVHASLYAMGEIMFVAIGALTAICWFTGSVKAVGHVSF